MFEWIQFKFGNSSRYCSDYKDDFTVLYDEDVDKNFKNLITHLSSILKPKYNIKHQMMLITSRQIGNFDKEWEKLKTKYQEKDIKYETSVIKITKNSKEIPERIKKWINNRNDTFFDKTKRKEEFKEKNEKKKKK